MNKERIATLLASGLSVSSVATIVGVSPARISQLQAEEGFSTIYAGKLAEIQKKDAEEVSISAKYLEAEHLLIKQIMEVAPVSELPAITAALRVVAERQDRAKLRANPVMQNTPVYNTIVQLNMPVHAVPEIAFSQTGEVIAIENRTLTPMSSKAVTDLFESMDTSKKGAKNEALPSIEHTEGSPKFQHLNMSKAGGQNTAKAYQPLCPLSSSQKKLTVPSEANRENRTWES